MKKFYGALSSLTIVLAACGQANVPAASGQTQQISTNNPLAGIVLQPGEMKTVTKEQYETIRALRASGKSISEIFGSNSNQNFSKLAIGSPDCANASKIGNGGKISSSLAFGGSTTYNIAIKMDFPSYWSSYEMDVRLNNTPYRTYYTSTAQLGIPRSSIVEIDGYARGTIGGNPAFSYGYLVCYT